MRIVAGRWRGRKIDAPGGDLVRPTGDRVRESWMSIVHHQLPEARVLDLCAGSGALGLEALSRGAAACDFVERSEHAMKVIRTNLDALGGHDGAVLHREEAVAFVSTLPALAYDVTFADPPYDADTALALVERWLTVPFSAILGIEHSSAAVMPAPGQTRRYGTTSLTFFRVSDP